MASRRSARPGLTLQVVARGPLSASAWCLWAGDREGTPALLRAVGPGWQAVEPAAGRALRLAVFPGAGAVGPRLQVPEDVELLRYRLSPRTTLLAAREALAPALAEHAPTHLAARDVQVGEARFSTAALTDPTRILGFLPADVLDGLALEAPRPHPTRKPPSHE